MRGKLFLVLILHLLITSIKCQGTLVQVRISLSFSHWFTTSVSAKIQNLALILVFTSLIRQKLFEFGGLHSNITFAHVCFCI